MQKTLVTFSLSLMLKVRIPDIPKLSRNAKGYLTSQNFRGTCREQKNKNSYVNCLITYMFTDLLFTTEDMKKIKFHDEMKCKVYTVLHLFLLVKMKNIIPNKISNGRHLKNLILQKLVQQQKIINLNAVIIHFYFQCTRITMNNISTSGGLTNKNIRKRS